jgi:hypothetical protein
VPLASLIRAIMLHFGAYVMVAPQTRISPPSQWLQHALVTLREIRILFGTYARPDSTLGVVGAAFGMACLVAAVFGVAKVVGRWRSASRAEQMLCAAVVINIAAYVVSTMPSPGATGAREIVAVVPCGAVLAARACVPARLVGAARARVAMAVAGIVALLPLAAAAAIPPATPAIAPIAAWLEAHGLRHGVSAYWDASALTVQSGNAVQVRAVDRPPPGDDRNNLVIAGWETDFSWYSPSRNEATFVIADPVRSALDGRIPANVFERYLGPPVAVHRVAGMLILIYQRNLLKQITPASGR